MNDDREACVGEVGEFGVYVCPVDRGPGVPVPPIRVGDHFCSAVDARGLAALLRAAVTWGRTFGSVGDPYAWHHVGEAAWCGIEVSGTLVRLLRVSQGHDLSFASAWGLAALLDTAAREAERRFWRLARERSRR